MVTDRILARMKHEALARGYTWDWEDLEVNPTGWFRVADVYNPYLDRIRSVTVDSDGSLGWYQGVKEYRWYQDDKTDVMNTPVEVIILAWIEWLESDRRA